MYHWWGVQLKYVIYVVILVVNQTILSFTHTVLKCNCVVAHLIWNSLYPCQLLFFVDIWHIRCFSQSDDMLNAASTNEGWYAYLKVSRIPLNVYLYSQYIVHCIYWYLLFIKYCRIIVRWLNQQETFAYVVSFLCDIVEHMSTLVCTGNIISSISSY